MMQLGRLQLYIMQNKKQFRLKTIQFDHLFNINPQLDTATYQFMQKRRPEVKFNQSQSNVKRQIYSHFHQTKEINYYRLAKKQNNILNKFHTFQINRQHLECFLATAKSSNSNSVFKKFPTRSKSIKNGNAVKFFMNSAATKIKSQISAREEDDFQLKLSQILKEKTIVAAKSSVKRNTESMTQIQKNMCKNLQQSRPKSMSMQSISDKKRRQTQGNRPINPEPWQFGEYDDINLCITDL